MSEVIEACPPVVAFLVHDPTGTVPDQLCSTIEQAEAWVRHITEWKPNARPIIEPNKEK